MPALTSFQILRRFHRELTPSDCQALWRYSELLLHGDAEIRRAILGALPLYEQASAFEDRG